MRYGFHPNALRELSEATLYYAAKNTVLGLAFYAEIERALRRILENPRLFAVVEEDVRGCRTRRFPYKILYTIEQDYMLIVAVMHCSRKPLYWMSRVKRVEGRG